jgi:anion-transporting  ArsA/GET3 family ATPase
LGGCSASAGDLLLPISAFTHAGTIAAVSEFPAVRLHVVSGKGGTGKTTVAASLALALATGGHQVLLVEVEGRQGIAQLFDTPPLPYSEQRVAVAHGGGEVYALAIDPEQALLEYLEQFYNLRRAGAALRKVGAIDFATTIAPGLRDVLLTGKVMEAATRGRSKRAGRAYDAVVLDAPPTGRITRFLNVNSEVAQLARLGPVRNQADSVMALLRSEETRVHLVTLLEEMPVQETVDGVGELTEAGLPVGAILVNMVRAPLLAPDDIDAVAAGTLDRPALVAGLAAAGVKAAGPTVDALAGEALESAQRALLQQRGRDVLDGTGRPRYELPLVDDAAELSGLTELAEHLQTSGLV